MTAEVSFTVLGDDGVRLFLDEQLLIDAWYPQHRIPHKDTRILKSGRHQIKLEYYEAGNGAEVHLNISGLSLETKEPIKLDYLRPAN